MLACLVLAVAVGAARAGVAVSPLKQEITLKPGEEGKVALTLTNRVRDEFGQAQSVRLEVLDVRAAEDGSLAFPPVGTMDTSASRWVSPGRTRVTIEPNQSERIECTIKPPLSAAPGEYYSAVMVTMETAGRTDKGVMVQYRIASGIFVTVSGRTFAKQAKIRRCELLWPEATEAPASQAAATQPAPPPMPRVSVLLENTGRARFNAAGKVRILDARSRVVCESPLLSRRECVFGGDSRLFEATLDKVLPAGRYTLKAEMDYESTWGKARYQMPVEILPEQEDLLAALNRRHADGVLPVEVEPQKIVLTAPPGAMRSLAFAAHNTGGNALHGVAGVAASRSAADAWVRVEPAEFAIAPSSRKTVALRVQVPPDAPVGTYATAVVLRAGELERRVPVEIEVRTERLP